MRPISRLPTTAALVLLVISAACSSDHNVAGPTDLNRQYRGTTAGGYPNESASFDLMVAATTTGTLKLVGGEPMAVAGTYVAATQLVTVSGGGFTLTGTIDGEVQYPSASVVASTVVVRGLPDVIEVEPLFPT